MWKKKLEHRTFFRKNDKNLRYFNKRQISLKILQKHYALKAKQKCS